MRTHSFQDPSVVTLITPLLFSLCLNNQVVLKPSSINTLYKNTFLKHSRFTSLLSKTDNSVTFWFVLERAINLQLVKEIELFLVKFEIIMLKNLLLNNIVCCRCRRYLYDCISFIMSLSWNAVTMHWQKWRVKKLKIKMESHNY
jgi:hypothetical protein